MAPHFDLPLKITLGTKQEQTKREQTLRNKHPLAFLPEPFNNRLVRLLEGEEVGQLEMRNVYTRCVYQTP